MKKALGILGSLAVVAVVMTVPKALVEAYHKKTNFSETIQDVGSLITGLRAQRDRVQGVLDALQADLSYASSMSDEAFSAAMNIYGGMQTVSLQLDMLSSVLGELHFSAVDAAEHGGDFCINPTLLKKFPGSLPTSCARISDEIKGMSSVENREYLGAAASAMAFCDSLFTVWPPAFLTRVQRYEDCPERPISAPIYYSTDDLDKVLIDAERQADALRRGAQEVRESSRGEALRLEKGRRLVVAGMADALRVFGALADRDKLLRRGTRGEHAVARLSRLEEDRVLGMSSLAVSITQLQLAASAPGAREQGALNAALAPLERAWKVLDDLEKQMDELMR